ncbi:hypothetical protein VULLAG_LOCUS18353 [Vulpes lagopus]
MASRARSQRRLAHAPWGSAALGAAGASEAGGGRRRSPRASCVTASARHSPLPRVAEAPRRRPTVPAGRCRPEEPRPRAPRLQMLPGAGPPRGSALPPRPRRAAAVRSTYVQVGTGPAPGCLPGRPQPSSRGRAWACSSACPLHGARAGQGSAEGGKGTLETVFSSPRMCLLLRCPQPQRGRGDGTNGAPPASPLPPPAPSCRPGHLRTSHLLLPVGLCRHSGLAKSSLPRVLTPL